MTNVGDQASPPSWRGFHHLALATAEFDATIRFYRDVLGMQVGNIVAATGQRGRHVFIKPGHTDAWGPHIWEHPQAPRRTPPAEWTAETLGAYSFEWGALNRVAFALPDEHAADALRARLESHGICATPPNSIGPLRNVLFFDNNGIMLEATWPGTGTRAPG